MFQKHTAETVQRLSDEGLIDALTMRCNLDAMMARYFQDSPWARLGQSDAGMLKRELLRRLSVSTARAA